MSEDIKQDKIAEEVIVEETVEEVTTEEVTEETKSEATVEAPLTKARTLSAINASLSEMTKDELDSIFEAAEKAKAKAKVEDDHEEDEDEDDDEEGEVESKKEAKVKKEAKKETKEEDFKEDLDALVKGEDSLSEGFKAKAATIFEAALLSKTTARTAELEAQYASDLTEEVDAIKEDLVDKVDGYLNYVVENWMKDNEVAVEHGLKSEITESFIDAMHGVFTEHYIDIPEDKVDIVDALTEEVTDAKEQLNTATANAQELAEKVKAFERKDIVAEACKGLAATEAEKLKKLCEGIDAVDTSEFEAKIATIKESYLNKDEAEATAETQVDAIVEEDKSSDKQEAHGDMAKYLDAIKRTKQV
jgi:hypothetical protein